MTLALSLILVLFLAYANGSNDNFKGVATLFGSKTTTYRKALIWATITTAMGSIVSLFLAKSLLATFSGKGLVPDAVVTMKSFSLAVVAAAAATVMLATRLGFPISTTHALTGALVGAGFLASPTGVNLNKLGGAFFMPLLLSPIVAVASSIAIYPLFRLLRIRSGVKKESCLCVGTQVIGPVPAGMGKDQAIAFYAGQTTVPTITIGTEASCMDRYKGNVMGINIPFLLDQFHYLSAGIVCFARALNDTPKIAAVLFAGALLPPQIAIGSVALLMGIGGWINSKKIADTMSLKVTEMNAGQGFTANLVTGVLVTLASNWGLPVSTTHVSCGSLFGIGTVTKKAHWKMILSILLAWVTTLPVAAVLGAATFSLLNRGNLL